MQNLNRWFNLHIVRNISSESAKVAATIAATPSRQPHTIKKSPRNVFGTLSESGRNRLARKVVERDLSEDLSGYDELEFDIEPRKNHFFYKYEITKHARLGSVGLRRALELFHEMKSKARIEPSIENFSPLIYGCAKAGFTKRAFELYDESLRYIKKPSNSIITCLINSCAESPFPDYGLKRLDWFMKHVKVEFNKSLNEIQYNGAIKAYGKLGNLDKASNLVQEMIDNQIYPSIDTFNMLLIGCASNKDAGCSLALRVYKRIKMYEIKPNLITYRLLLRCIRDCGMGPPELLAETIKELPAVTSLTQRLEYRNLNKKLSPKQRSGTTLAWAPLLTDMGKSLADAVKVPAQTDKALQTGRKIPRIDAKQAGLTRDKTLVNLSSPEKPLDAEVVPVVEQPQETLPNLLSSDHLNLMLRIESIQFDKLRNKVDRLQLFGGLHGYLANMLEDGCKPDSKTFSLLLDCIEPKRENYLEYYKLAEQVNVKRDLVFYDLLIKHICARMRFGSRLEFALSFVEKMHMDNLRPNISTLEALARGCHDWKQAHRLIEDIKKCGFIVSEVMIANFFHVAISRSSFDYLIDLINHCKRINFSPNRLLVERLESLRLRAHEKILQQEKFGGSEVCFTDQQVRDFDEFRPLLGLWLKKVDLREEEHPWSQFQVEHGSKNQKFKEYAKQMVAANLAKREAMTKGEEHLGNLYERSQELIKARE